MNKTAIFLVSFVFFGLGSYSKQLATKEELNFSQIAEEQRALFRLAPETFTPPTRTRGKKWHNVRSYGAVGNGIADDTKAFQKAIDALPEDGGTVFVPPGTYLINGDLKDVERKEISGNSIRLRSKMHLRLSPYATLKQKPTDAYASAIIYAFNVSDVEISGGKVIGDLDEHRTTTGEHGHGVLVKNAERVTIRDIHASKCWGDGFYVGGTIKDATKSFDVVFDKVISTSNRRQGLSITEADSVQVWNSEFNETGLIKGTAPKCGIDIEPGKGITANDILIQNCVMRNNASYGILIYKRAKNVTIQHSEIVENNKAGIVCEAPVNTFLSFNEIYNNTSNGLVIKAGVSGIRVTQNTFHENKGHSPRSATLEISGLNSETEKDIFLNDEASDISIETNIFK